MVVSSETKSSSSISLSFGNILSQYDFFVDDVFYYPAYTSEEMMKAAYDKSKFSPLYSARDKGGVELQLSVEYAYLFYLNF